MAKKEIKENQASVETEQTQLEVFDNSSIKSETVMNFEYVQSEDTKGELNKIIDALRPKTSVRVKERADKQHDLLVFDRDGRQVIRVCPLRKRISSSLPGDKGKIIEHNLSTILKAIEKFE